MKLSPYFLALSSLLLSIQVSAQQAPMSSPLGKAPSDTARGPTVFNPPEPKPASAVAKTADPSVGRPPPQNPPKPQPTPTTLTAGKEKPEANALKPKGPGTPPTIPPRPKPAPTTLEGKPVQAGDGITPVGPPPFVAPKPKN